MHQTRLDSGASTNIASTRAERGRSANRLLHERNDPRFVRRSQIADRKGRRPHMGFVEVRLVAEAKRSIRIRGFVNVVLRRDRKASAARPIRSRPIPHRFKVGVGIAGAIGGGSGSLLTASAKLAMPQIFLWRTMYM